MPRSMSNPPKCLAERLNQDRLLISLLNLPAARLAPAEKCDMKSDRTESQLPCLSGADVATPCAPIPSCFSFPGCSRLWRAFILGLPQAVRGSTVTELRASLGF
ncbi:unnamed protein product [Effrenium voratum]|uniref:Uncharacterized protein n=1 Tax=Effrenium voratum TaxID=2562239 RepID=A0AA36JPD1_9DINO|nr:unnamed protein product [Effrenium voratum]CAJ1427809.1 unnamed protein product [Effrenium voratum]